VASYLQFTDRGSVPEQVHFQEIIVFGKARKMSKTGALSVENQKAICFASLSNEQKKPNTKFGFFVEVGIRLFD
jgi:hypothetical protein